MVRVPEGEFTMGSNEDAEESPPHRVYLGAYWIDRTEVSNAQYNKCVQAGVCNTYSSCWFGSPTLGTGQPDHPVGCIMWYDALNYCTWVGARLPTEAEWEKAARGTDARSYPWGSGSPDCGKAQSSACGAHSVPVGSNSAGASPYGALNMAGNVWEWTQDWHKNNYYAESPYENPTGGGPGSGKMVRGGSWDAGAFELRSAFRSAIQPDYTGSDLGFRCARD
jgi:serine/threonine-protein kinase